MYELVVIDTPPLVAVSDAFPLLTLVDGVIIVGRVGRNRRDVAARLHETLVGAGAPLVGIVANGVKASPRGPYGYGYDYTAVRAKRPSRAEKAERKASAAAALSSTDGARPVEEPVSEQFSRGGMPLYGEAVDPFGRLDDPPGGTGLDSRARLVRGLLRDSSRGGPAPCTLPLSRRPTTTRGRRLACAGGRWRCDRAGCSRDERRGSSAGAAGHKDEEPGRHSADAAARCPDRRHGVQRRWLLSRHARCCRARPRPDPAREDHAVAPTVRGTGARHAHRDRRTRPVRGDHPSVRVLVSLAGPSPDRV